MCHGKQAWWEQSKSYELVMSKDNAVELVRCLSYFLRPLKGTMDDVTYRRRRLLGIYSFRVQVCHCGADSRQTDMANCEWKRLVKSQSLLPVTHFPSKFYLLIFSKQFHQLGYQNSNVEIMAVILIQCINHKLNT